MNETFQNFRIFQVSESCYLFISSRGEHLHLSGSLYACKQFNSFFESNLFLYIFEYVFFFGIGFDCLWDFVTIQLISDVIVLIVTMFFYNQVMKIVCLPQNFLYLPPINMQLFSVQK
eukprot:TRINITY_DN15722_c1_g1_i5.p1 TRINITY_DN15722_c1_g1~~TRINITY_DN15722_c1_g1_i5.p1  ORF type:complete len:117 (+),score=1.14 TRINITY_DN15722_c1_g1_i5:202-552(+)